MPKKSPTKTSTEIQLTKEVKSLTKEVKKLKDLEFVRILKHPWKFLWLAFLKGLMVGFGSVLGATVLVAVFIYIISKVSFVPVIGDFVEDIIEEIGVSQEQLSETNEG